MQQENESENENERKKEGKDPAGKEHAMFLMGGLHAREWLSPAVLIVLAEKVLREVRLVAGFKSKEAALETRAVCELVSFPIVGIK